MRKNLESQLQPKSHFLGFQPVQQSVPGQLQQVQQVQQPCLGQLNQNPQALLEIQKSQKQMMDLFLNLSQKVNSKFM